MASNKILNRHGGKMKEQLKLKAHWACRRGMRELDLLLMPFFEQTYDELCSEQQGIFLQLLAYDDSLLFQWFMKKSQPQDKPLMDLIELILQHNQRTLMSKN